MTLGPNALPLQNDLEETSQSSTVGLKLFKIDGSPSNTNMQCVFEECDKKIDPRNERIIRSLETRGFFSGG